MDKTEVKRLVVQGILALIVLILPIAFLFVFPALVLSLWITGLIILIWKKRQNPRVIESNRFQTAERLLYFQIISWAFAFFYLPLMIIIAPIISIVVLFLAFNKQRRENPKFIKWAKYVGFQLFNIILLFVLFNFFPNIGGEEGLFALSIITLFNGATAALYLKVEPSIRADKRTLSLIIMIIMIVVTTMTRFPQYGGTTIFGG